jgi:hypothetical protein
LRTAWQRHGLGLPPRPAALRPAATWRLDAAFAVLNRKLLPTRVGSDEELAARVRRAEEYATLGAEAVVEMDSETYGKRPAARVWAIICRASASTAALTTAKPAASAARPTALAAPIGPADHTPGPGSER